MYLQTEDGGDYHKQPEGAASSQTLCCSLTVRQRVGETQDFIQCAGAPDSFLGFQTQHDVHICSIRTTSLHHMNRRDVTSFGCDG